MGRLETIRDWAIQYPGYGGLMQLNALVWTSGEGGLSAEGGEVVEKRYIDGTEERSVECVLRVAVPWSEGSDELNPDAAELMEGWADWVSDQWPDNPPVFDDAVVVDMSPAQTLPEIESVNETGRAAVYRLALDFEIRI